MKALMINMQEFKFDRELECDFVLRQGMYYRINGEMYLSAFIYPESKRAELQALLDELKAAKTAYDNLFARIAYKDLPKLKP